WWPAGGRHGGETAEARRPVGFAAAGTWTWLKLVVDYEHLCMFLRN
ncbi:hypothetical protein A2U01_0057805, partial [Trifolium medium]|nr:hypothetical protein [Trifolium medium]